MVSELAIIQTTSIILSPALAFNANISTNSSEPVNFKFFVPRNINAAIVRVNLAAACADCPELMVSLQAGGVPSQKTYLQNTVIGANQTDVQLDFYPHHDTWHYVDVYFLQTESSDPVINGTAVDSVLDGVDVVHHVDFSIRVDFLDNEEEQETADETVELNKSLPQRGFEYYTLLRQTYREFFMFDFDLLPDANGTVPAYLNVSGGTPAAFRFNLGDVYDIGGTLSFAVAMRETFKDLGRTLPESTVVEKSGEAVAEKLVDSNQNVTAIETKTTAAGRSNQTIIICMRLEEPGIPTWPDQCLYGRNLLPAASVINNTNDETSTGLIHVPFPESGEWFVTMGLFCHGSETAARNTIIDSVKDFIHQYVDVLDDIRKPCACKNNSEFYANCIQDKQCLASMNETETLKVKECLMDSKCTVKHSDMAKKFELHHRVATEQSVASDESCNASALFTISSSPCVAGRCGRFGRCYHYMSGGFVFSTCLCSKGYRGWDCTEDSQVPSSMSILVALLLLTLSNLLFLPSIYFGIRRKYYTESVIYFFAMFFSIFYHACDSGEEEYSFCLVKLGVLQFCDFYCGLLAIWVTLIAMAHIRPSLVSLFHMFGAILLAFGTELNKQSLWVFLAPALTGICIISVSWGLRCRRTRKLFPSRRYLAGFLPIGAVLVMVGLVCYAFLQTRQNYHIVHSVWHMLMALSILCLLPSRHSFLPKC